MVQKHIYTPDYAKLHNIRRDALLPINKNSINNILGRVNSFLRERPSGQLAATADSAATMVVLAGQAVAETSSIMPTSGQAAAQLVEVAGQPTEEELSAAWAAAMETPIVEDEEEVEGVEGDEENKEVEEGDDKEEKQKQKEAEEKEEEEVEEGGSVTGPQKIEPGGQEGDQGTAVQIVDQ